jgi:hypothetical protein
VTISLDDHEAYPSSLGLGFDVNLYEADDRATGGWFGHSGFNSGYLTKKRAARARSLMANAPPEHMSGDVPNGVS